MAFEPEKKLLIEQLNEVVKKYNALQVPLYELGIIVDAEFDPNEYVNMPLVVKCEDIDLVKEPVEN